MRQMKEMEVEEKRIARHHEIEMAKMELQKKKMESRVCVVL